MLWNLFTVKILVLNPFILTRGILKHVFVLTIWRTPSLSILNTHMIAQSFTCLPNTQSIFKEFSLTPQSYIHINELMLMIGAETFSQSDGFWTCRIRRMLLQLLNSLYDIFIDQQKLKLFEPLESYNSVTICAEYIHSHYAENITLSALCELVNLNRTSLNQKFKAQFSCTCMEYLLNYRLKISQELLSNSNMKIHEIAECCGFKYDSYFIKQFTAKLGISPAMYRKNPLTYSAYDGKNYKNGV